MKKLLFYANFILLSTLKSLCSDISKKPDIKIGNLANEFVIQVAQGTVSKEITLEYLSAFENKEASRNPIAEALLLNQLFLINETLFWDSCTSFKAEVFDFLPVHENMLSIESLNRLREIKDSTVIFDRLFVMLNKLLEIHNTQFTISETVPKEYISVARTIILLALEKYSEIDSTMIVFISDTEIFQDRDLLNMLFNLNRSAKTNDHLKSEFHKQFCEEYNKRNFEATSLCPTDDLIKLNIDRSTTWLKHDWFKINMDSKAYFEIACRKGIRIWVYSLCNIINGNEVKAYEKLLKIAVELEASIENLRGLAVQVQDYKEKLLEIALGVEAHEVMPLQITRKVKAYEETLLDIALAVEAHEKKLLEIALGRNVFLKDLAFKTSSDLFTKVLQCQIISNQSSLA